MYRIKFPVTVPGVDLLMHAVRVVQALIVNKSRPLHVDNATIQKNVSKNVFIVTISVKKIVKGIP